MALIRVKQGLDLPLFGAPKQILKRLEDDSTFVKRSISVDFEPFKEVFLKVLVHEGDHVVALQPLVHVKDQENLCIPSPVEGKVVAIIRGEKRRLLEIVIEEALPRVAPITIAPSINPTSINELSSEKIEEKLLRSGLLTRFFVRPFHRPVMKAKPTPPRSCFIRACTTKLFDVPYKMQFEGKEKWFILGLEVISKYLGSIPIHVVTGPGSLEESKLRALFPSNNQQIHAHTVDGIYPVCSSSLHIQKIDPIQTAQDSVWAIDALDVIRIGCFFGTDRLDMPFWISLAGEGVEEKSRGYLETIEGAAISDIVHNRLTHSNGDQLRIVSGDLLTGKKVLQNEYMKRGHTMVSVIPEQKPEERTFLHFLRIGANSFTATDTYLSGHMNRKTHLWHMNTNMHGEERHFIDASVYEKVMPLNILPMQIVKAVMAKEYDLAIDYGLLEVVADDFAACEFICPSKIPMMQIVEEGIDQLIADLVT